MDYILSARDMPLGMSIDVLLNFFLCFSLGFYFYFYSSDPFDMCFDVMGYIFDVEFPGMKLSLLRRWESIFIEGIL